MALSKSTRIIILLAIDSVFFFVELITGYAVHSLALVADSFHMLNDVLSLCVGLWAVKVANEKTNSKMYTYGVSLKSCLQQGHSADNRPSGNEQRLSARW